jgi:hypothetical protein
MRLSRRDRLARSPRPGDAEPRRYATASRRGVGLAASQPESVVRRDLRVGVPFRQALEIQRSIGPLVQEFDVLQIQLGADFVVDVEVRQIWLGRRAALAFALHLPEQFLETTRQRRDVVNDARLAPEPQLVAIANKALRIPAERNRALHVFFGRAADQVREARGGDHAAAKPRSEAPTLKREDRQAHGQSVRGGGMRPVGRRVEEKISQRYAREMMRVGGLVGEKDALGAHAPLRGGVVQPLVRFGVAREEPKHAVRDLLEDRHPEREAIRG